MKLEKESRGGGEERDNVECIADRECTESSGTVKIGWKSEALDHSNVYVPCMEIVLVLYT